jgi:serine/threonine protein kinase/Tfp pilus assembly protein PilF
MKCPQCGSENTSDSRFCRNCASPLAEPGEYILTETIRAPAKELDSGTVFAGRYQVIEELGRGGMGRVYRVLDKKLGEEVALKLIKPEVASDEKTIQRFRNELRTTRKIGHPNVTRMYDLGEDQGTHYITMEYVRGEDLKSFIRRSGRLTVDKAITIAGQVCEGLAEAHRQGIVHRDLKPQNVMIDRDGNARIMDFGIARSLTGKGITGEGTFIGTPEYMSPEQVEGRDIDQRSDIYSLGIVLYEMLTGRRPFEGDTALDVAVKQKSETPPDPKLLNPQISDELDRVILRSLEKKKESRYQSAMDLLSDLEAVKKGLTTTEKAPAIKPKLMPDQKSQWQGSVAVLPFTNMSADPEQEYFCDGMAEEIINALTQVEGLRVLARTSAFSFKGKNVNVREIGRELDVEAVLEGSVRKAGNRLRITAQLINVADGFHLWSERFDRDMADVFVIQDEISRAIVDKLEVKLLGKKKATLVKRRTADPEAYNLYLKGRSSLQMMTEEGFKRSVDYLETAAAKDPDFALPLAGLSTLYFARSYWGKMRPHDAYPKAREYARQALEKDDTLGEAYAASGSVRTFYDWDWPGAERDFRKALELNPNSPDIHQAYSFFLTITARHDEAVIQAKKAMELDPLSSFIRSHAAQSLFFAGRPDEALELLKETISFDPTFFFPHYTLFNIYENQSKAELFLKECEKTVELSGGHPLAIMGLFRAYIGLGRTAETEKLEKSLGVRSRVEYIPPMCFFGIHLWHKNLEKAAEWLEQACAERDSFLLWILVYPNPRRRVPDLPIFNDILKKYGLKS